MRGLICEWTNQAITQSRKHTHLFKRSQKNFGLHLPYDGSKDGDIDLMVS